MSLYVSDTYYFRKQNSEVPHDAEVIHEATSTDNVYLFPSNPEVKTENSGQWFVILPLNTLNYHWISFQLIIFIFTTQLKSSYNNSVPLPIITSEF